MKKMNSIEYWDKFVCENHILGEATHIKEKLAQAHKTKFKYIDIGANVGKFYDYFDRYFEIEACLMVEPSPVLFDYLQEKFRDKEGVSIVNYALSDKDGKASFFQEELDRALVATENFVELNLGLSRLSNKNIPSSIEVKTKNSKIFFEEHIELLKEIALLKIDTETHDYFILKGLYEVLLEHNITIPAIYFENNNHPDLSDDQRKNIYDKFLKTLDYEGVDFEMLTGNASLFQKTNKDHSITIVTGLWDIKRDELSEGWSRTFDHYLDKFNELLDLPNNLIVFGEEGLREFVFTKRTPRNTQFIVRPQSWFRNNFYDKIQEIRTSEDWKSQAGWLRESTQSRLAMYNPLVMSKPFLLNDARILDQFDSTHLYWLDAGITNTVHPGYFTHDKVLEKLADVDCISFIAFPYIANNEIHGFDYKKLCELAGDKVNKVCRGGFFGGPKSAIAEFNGNYYQLLSSTLSEGYMGTEESLFSIMLYKYPYQYQYSLIEENGLISTFFEAVKNDNHTFLIQENEKKKTNNLNVNNTALYVITFNSPNQVKALIKSMLLYDKDFVEKPKWIMLDNSSDLSTTSEYKKICVEHDILHIKKDNLGICGGRQFIAEHAEENGFDYYFFFEDDMFFYPKEGEVCKNGFNRYVGNLYKKSLQIIKKNNFDFLKLSFTEFFGDNKTQWAWYNVPQSFREKHWPEKSQLPTEGLDPDAPQTVFNNIGMHEGIPFADGEIYYCNWPQVVSKIGNKKMFLKEKWASPFEQTWMSYMYQETIQGNLYPGILLLSPTEHDRFEHYDGSLRKESGN